MTERTGGTSWPKIGQNRAWSIAMAVLIVKALTECGSANAQTRPSANDSLLYYGARVKFTVGSTNAWLVGVAGRVGECVALFPLDPRAERQVVFRAVPVDSLTRILVSNRYDGRKNSSGMKQVFKIGADTSREGWGELPVAELRKRYGGCAGIRL